MSENDDNDMAKYSYDFVKDIADYLLERTKIRPKVAIICGTGLGSLVDFVTESQAFDYSSIPNFPVSAVEGHVGCLLFGYIECMPAVLMQGRFHHYEGYSLAKCSMPVRVMKLLGADYLLATNAAGAVNSNYQVGDIMLIQDHVNWFGFAGNSPLCGPNDSRFGPRFPPVTNAYDRQLIAKAMHVAQELDIDNNVHRGVYTCVGGPTYETIAELKLLQAVGVDAVGMSTVNEVVTARHCGMKVFTFSLITDKCPLDYESKDSVNHEDIMNVAMNRQHVCGELMLGVIREIARENMT